MAQLPEQLPVIKKELGKDLWYAENILAMQDRENDRFFDMMGKLNHLFTMTCGTEPTTTAGEREQIFVVTVRTADTSKPFMQITTFQIVIDDMRDYRPLKTVITSKSPIITGFELGKVRIQQLPEW